MSKILIIGAGGQLGSELTIELRKIHGADKVVASDLRPTTDPTNQPFVTLDALDPDALFKVVKDHEIDEVYHLAAILSARGEDNPLLAWDINMKSLLNVLELGREKHISKIYWPSSIAVFGPETPKINTPQRTIMNPTTVYGISKLAGERWCDYYHLKYGVDVRSLRYPGLIGYKAQPGGGTTDYAVDIFFKAVNEEPFTCFLKEDTMLPMMYMDDAIRGTVELMQADSDAITIRTSYNIAAMSFTPTEIIKEVRKHIPNLSVEMQPDFRQTIADSWPQSIDDSRARNDWGWAEKFDLPEMTERIISSLEKVGV